jgi:hypothetical protein
VSFFSLSASGKYLGKNCALKLVFTPDLTVETIRRVAAEAALLASVKVSPSCDLCPHLQQSPNVLNIFGVSVLPPRSVLSLPLLSEPSQRLHRPRAVCLWFSCRHRPQRPPEGKESVPVQGRQALPWLGLRQVTPLMPRVSRLALLTVQGPGCTACSESLRDPQRHQVLQLPGCVRLPFPGTHSSCPVDSQLNAKLADLELGHNAAEYAELPDAILINWVAPEVPSPTHPPRAHSKVDPPGRRLHASLRHLCAWLGSVGNLQRGGSL